MEIPTTKEQWLAAIEENYKSYVELTNNQDSRKEHTASMFQLTTYDSGISELFGEWIMEVLTAIVAGDTRSFMDEGERYIKFLTVINFKHMEEILEWSVSVRNARIGHTMKFEPFWGFHEPSKNPIITTRAGFNVFFEALTEFFHTPQEEKEE